ncbi:MAG: VanW family protein, partial [Candidatus Promineifilaceae bacterium]
MTTSDSPSHNDATPSRLANFFRFLAWMLLLPLLALLIVAGLTYTQVNQYFAQHENQIYVGINALDVDLSGLSKSEAIEALSIPAERFENAAVEFVDPRSDTVQVMPWSELGVTLNVEEMVDQALLFGRNRPADDQAIFWAWYQGQTLAPTWQIDAGTIDSVVYELANNIDQSVMNATVALTDGEIAATDVQTGYTLDRTALQADLLAAAQGHLAEWQPIQQVTLAVSTEAPQVMSVGVAAEEAAVLTSGPLSFYVESPLTSADLQPIKLTTAQIESWMTLDNSSSTAQIELDTSEIKRWLFEIAPNYAVSAERARFYFDDLTKELVLIKPHVNGRSLNVNATYEQVVEKIRTPDRNIQLIMNEIEPDIHSDVKAADLGITELLSSETTYFYDSSPERKHNIQLGATKFHGLVLVPGEEFSFNQYLGEISKEAGFQDGLVIIGGRTQSGIGGGICQVSTTLFQTVFWSGLAVGARNQHGYRVPYYEMAPGNSTKPLGMDAAIYSPIVDFTFTNNSTHHLLLETYYRADDESLAFKFYSTDLGRTIDSD